MGSGPMPSKKWTKPLTALVAAGAQNTPEYVKDKIAFVKKREKIAPLYFNRAIEALEQIAEKAAEYGVKLAVESRSRFEDMPTEREMVKLQEHFAGNEWVGYWHDFGHVQLKHNLGLLDHHEWLEKMAGYIIGGHVHDVQWPARDHRTPFTGTLDYEPLLRFFPAGCPLIWELSPTRKAEEIRQMLTNWQSKFPNRS